MSSKLAFRLLLLMMLFCPVAWGGTEAILSDCSTVTTPGYLCRDEEDGSVCIGTGSVCLKLIDHVNPIPSGSTLNFSSGYLLLQSGTSPASVDCDESSEASRLFFDTDLDTDGSLMICRGTAGWKDIDDDGGAGGAGDIEDVWGCATGNCNALTAAAGDSLNASSADSTDPFEESTTAGPTTEGTTIWDTNDDVLEVGDAAEAIPMNIQPLVLSDNAGRSASFFLGPFGCVGVSETPCLMSYMPMDVRIQDCTCRVFTTPGGTATWTCHLEVNNTSQVNCVIANPATSCTLSGSVSVSSGQEFHFSFLESGTAAGTGGASASCELAVTGY